MSKSRTILHLIAWIMLILIFINFSCVKKPYALNPDGVPLRQDGDRILTVFPEYGGDPNRFHATWFYFPGMSLIDPHTYRIRVILERKYKP